MSIAFNREPAKLSTWYHYRGQGVNPFYDRPVTIAVDIRAEPNSVPLLTGAASKAAYAFVNLDGLAPGQAVRAIVGDRQEFGPVGTSKVVFADSNGSACLPLFWENRPLGLGGQDGTPFEWQMSIQANAASGGYPYWMSNQHPTNAISSFDFKPLEQPHD